MNESWAMSNKCPSCVYQVSREGDNEICFGWVDTPKYCSRLEWPAERVGELGKSLAIAVLGIGHYGFSSRDVLKHRKTTFISTQRGRFFCVAKIFVVLRGHHINIQI